MIACEPRRDKEELIDRTDLPFAELDRSLSDLEWSNKWLGGRSALLRYLGPEYTSFLDVGCGSGDMLRAIDRRGGHPRLVGVDLNPAVIDIAKMRNSKHPDIEYVLGGATALPFDDDSFDVVFSSTFIHHLTELEAVEALREAARVARRRVVIVDLVRCSAGRIGVWLIGRLAYGRLSRYDGPASFERAYRPSELIELATKAGLVGARIRRHHFYRMALVYDKEAI